MKAIPFLLMCCLAINGAFGQTYLPFDSVTAKITYKEIIKIDSLTAKKGYEEALTWVGQYMDTLKKMPPSELFVEKKDEDSNKIVASGKFQAVYSDNWNKDWVWVYYSLIIETKNGRSRIKLTDLRYGEPGPHKTMTEGTFEEMYYGLNGKPKNVQTAWLGFFTSCDVVLKSIVAAYHKYMLRPAPPKPMIDNW